MNEKMDPTAQQVITDTITTIFRHETYKASRYPLPYLEITPTAFRYVDEDGFVDINPVIENMFDLKRIRDMFSINCSMTGTRRAICEVFNLYTVPFYHCTPNAVAVAIDDCQWLGWDWTKILKDQHALKKQYFEKHSLTTAGSKTMQNYQIEYIAKNVHNANCDYCKAHGDFVDPEWDALPEDRRQSIRDAVRAQIENPAVNAEASHQRWMECRLAEGWVYGPVKDLEAKTHPCLVAYDQLPEAQQYKDKLFASNVARFAALSVDKA